MSKGSKLAYTAQHRIAERSQHLGIEIRVILSISDLMPAAMTRMTGMNRLMYLWGHLTAIHDALVPLLDSGPKLHPEFDIPFISNPDKDVPNIPSAEEVKNSWNEVNGELRKSFEKLSTAEWLQKHAAVSGEDFAKDSLRYRFAIILSRTNHLSYHLGQAVLASKNLVWSLLGR
jgi:hypothetical protein